jgi:hypothetical protein
MQTLYLQTFEIDKQKEKLIHRDMKDNISENSEEQMQKKRYRC